MKINLLYSSVLFILLISSLPSEARNKSSTKGAKEGGRGRGELLGGKKVSEKIETLNGQTTAEINRITPERNTLEDPLNFTRVVEDKKDETTPKLLTPTFTVSKIPTNTPKLASQEAQMIIDTLKSKVTISEKTTRALKTVIQDNAELGQALKKLAEKVQSDPSIIRTEDIQTMVEYTANMKWIERTTLKNPENPEAANVLMDIGSNLYDMANWSEAPRKSAMDLMRKFNTRVNEGESNTTALEIALAERGHKSEPARRKRKREIREECGK